MTTNVSQPRKTTVRELMVRAGDDRCCAVGGGRRGAVKKGGPGS
jgi:hypothetical protein